MEHDANAAIRVLKFGGTSVGSGERFRSVAGIVADTARSRRSLPVVVVSAMEGVTDSLLRIAALACGGRAEAVLAELDQLRQQHVEAATTAVCTPHRRAALLLELDECFRALKVDIDGLPAFYAEHGPLADASQVAAWGERLAVRVLAAALADCGVRASAVREEVIVVAGCSARPPGPPPLGAVIGSNPLLPETRARADMLLHPLLGQGTVPVVPGFIGRTTSGFTRTLGRGGSDLSATVLAAVLEGCDEVDIYTDVDGVLSADPRLVGEGRAQLLPRLSYAEAASLAGLGARVLHPHTLMPVASRGIPVLVRNTFFPHRPGTLIGREDGHPSCARAIVLLRDLVLVTLERQNGGGSDGAGTLLRAALSSGVGGLPFALCLLIDGQISVLLEVRNLAAALATCRLEDSWQARIRSDLCACVCLGSGFAPPHAHPASSVYTLAEEGIGLLACATTEQGTVLVVEGYEGTRALRCLHESLIVRAGTPASRLPFASGPCEQRGGAAAHGAPEGGKCYE